MVSQPCCTISRTTQRPKFPEPPVTTTRFCRLGISEPSLSRRRSERASVCVKEWISDMMYSLTGRSRGDRGLYTRARPSPLYSHLLHLGETGPAGLQSTRNRIPANGEWRWRQEVCGRAASGASPSFLHPSYIMLSQLKLPELRARCKQVSLLESYTDPVARPHWLLQVQ